MRQHVLMHGDCGRLALLDTGSPVKGLMPAGKRRNFYAGFGELEIDVLRVRAEIGGRRLVISTGVLPPMLQMMFGMMLGNDAGIVGSDFFHNRVTVVDYIGNQIVDVTT